MRAAGSIALKVNWQEQTSPQLSVEPSGAPVVAILPLGAVEAHGPHLPVGTDIWIAEAMARAGAERLMRDGLRSLVLPAIPYAPAPFAAAHPGTLTVRSETLQALVGDLATAAADRGVRVLAFANAHFDPAQIRVLRASAEAIGSAARLQIAYPDLTRRRWAERLGEEFRSGACHAGRYETSILLACRPELVDDSSRRRLAALPISLVEAATRGATTFGEAGLDLAYCGDPAAATAEEGRALIDELGAILAEAVRAALG